ncbi:hypothetical protein D3C80_483060 [compost metagenome]
MAQKVANAAFGDCCRPCRNRAATRKLGRHKDFACFFCGCIVHAYCIDLDHPHGERSRKGFDGSKALGFLSCIGQGMCGGIRQEIECAAPGMKVHDDIGCGQQIACEVIGDFFRHSSIWTAGETTIEIAFIYRRCARSGHEGREIHRRNNNNASVDLSRFQIGGEIVEGNRSFVFIAVIATRKKGCGSIAIANDADGQHQRAPGGIVSRPR